MRIFLGLFFIASSVFAVEPAAMTGEYLYYFGKNQEGQQDQGKPLVKQDISSAIERQNILFQKLIDQQASMITSLQEANKKQSDELARINKMLQMDFAYRRAVQEAEFKSNEDLFAGYFGFKRESISEYYNRIGVGAMLNSYDQKLKKESQNVQ